MVEPNHRISVDAPDDSVEAVVEAGAAHNNDHHHLILDVNTEDGLLEALNIDMSGPLSGRSAFSGQSARSSSSSFRGSALSNKYFGPPVSKRTGRPDHFKSCLLSAKGTGTTEQLQSIQDEESGKVTGGAFFDNNDDKNEGDEFKEEMEAEASTKSAPDPAGDIAPQRYRQSMIPQSSDISPSDRHEMRLAIKRLSVIQARKDDYDPNLVQVKLKNVSYFVPIQMDGPTKKTVINQSLCYLTFEFFNRLTKYCTGGGGNNNNNNTQGVIRADSNVSNSKKDWVPSELEEVFTPYQKVPVLNNVNLVLSPGQCYLVLGPPASGKTTLLKAIAGRLYNAAVNPVTGEPKKEQPHLTGTIEYNDCTTKDDANLVLPNIVTFVGQLDVHAPYLTVKETFDFAYACRTGKEADEKLEEGKEAAAEERALFEDSAQQQKSKPSSFRRSNQKQDKPASENLTITGLGLAHVADTFVGNSDVRGVSGGQRRRVTVGEMMQGQAPVACADEISTGLDAAVTYDICKSIVDFSKAVRTTRVVSLLQPGPETFALFDQVIVLSEGYVVFCGAVGDVEEHFESLGYYLPATMDVADFIQCVTTPDGELLFDEERSPFDHHLSSAEFAEAFQRSRHAKKIADELNTESGHSWKKKKSNNKDNSTVITTTSTPTVNIPENFTKEFQNTWWQAMVLNFRRHLILWWRDQGFIIGKMFENIGMAVATGGILFGKGTIPDGLFPLEEPLSEWQIKQFQRVQDGICSALFMTCLHILLGTTTSAPDEIDGRPIHYKQGDANFYQTSAYVFGRLISTLPQRAIEIVAFGIPLYWMVGLDPTPQSFFLYLCIVLSYTFGLKMLYSIIAQSLPNKDNILSFGTFLVLLFSMFSGFIVFPGQVPPWFIWIYFLNPMAWAFQGLLYVEFSSVKYSNVSPTASGLKVFMGNRGFPIIGDWKAYPFAFLIPYVLVMAGILCVVLKRVRLQPVMNAPLSHEKLIATEEDREKEDFNFPFTPVDLTFENIEYEVVSSTTNETLKLLNKVNGIFSAGRMCALMGSSGAGKTTLMDVIALRKTSGTINGETRLNGYLQDRVSFLRCSGYVEQFDVQQPELTVRETVAFSARLRLDSNNPVTADDKGKLKFVDYVLDLLELTNIQHLQVGSFALGGLTFEQRKRLAIAVELAASPSVIFLDEPTSGLDSRGALIIMRAMKAIANTNRTVVSTIHQPSSAVFHMFDDLLLLKRGGEVVFYGELGEESSNLVEYFEAHGADQINHGENPAAWMLRAYTGAREPEDWKERYEQSAQFKEMKEKIASIQSNLDESKKIQFETEFAADKWTQINLMNIRVFKIMMRAPSYTLARLMIAVLYAFVIGCVFLGSQFKTRVYSEYEVSGILSTIFMGITIMGVASISMAVPMMKTIRDVFYKHRASGMLDHNSISIAITLGEIPFIIMVSAIFSAVYYPLVGLFETANRWFEFFGYFALNQAVYVYFGQAFICLVKDVPTAGALVGALIGFNVFFSGLVVLPQYFVGPFQLGFWTAPGRFAFEALVVSQFKGLDYTVIPQNQSPYWHHLKCDDLEVAECTGKMEDFVNFYFGGRFIPEHIPIDLGVLFFCLFLARLLCYVALKYFNYVNT